MKTRETFLIRLKDLSKKLKDQIAKEASHYTVPIIINDIPIGSGTLVQVDGFYGVLTAEHVVRHPKRPELHLTNSERGGPQLFIPPAEFPGGKAIESSVLRVFPTDRKEDDYGPDLAFVALPLSPLLSELKARRSFYPLTNAIDDKVAAALDDIGYVSFNGYPASHRIKKPAAFGYSECIELRGFAFITGPDKHEVRGDWDYFELGITREEAAEFNETFGGVSGGGVWRIPVHRKKGEPEGSEFLGRPTLAGVAFVEENHWPKGRFFVRTHGPKSIYQTFLPALREQLREMK